MTTLKTFADLKTVFDVAVDSNPKLTRGQVWCTKCGATFKLDSKKALGEGWPKCCGHTMTIDSPEERNALT